MHQKADYEESEKMGVKIKRTKSTLLLYDKITSIKFIRSFCNFSICIILNNFFHIKNIHNIFFNI